MKIEPDDKQTQMFTSENNFSTLHWLVTATK